MSIEVEQIRVMDPVEDRLIIRLRGPLSIKDLLDWLEMYGVPDRALFGVGTEILDVDSGSPNFEEYLTLRWRPRPDGT